MDAFTEETESLVGTQGASSMNSSYGGCESDDSGLPGSLSISCEAGKTTKRRSIRFARYVWAGRECEFRDW